MPTPRPTAYCLLPADDFKLPSQNRTPPTGDRRLCSSPSCLSPEQVAMRRGIRRSAIVLVAMRLLEGPAGARDLAALLMMNEHTIARHLDQLAFLNLVARCGHRQEYVACPYCGKDPCSCLGR